MPGDSDIAKPTKNGINKKLLPFGAHKHDGAARNAKIYVQKDCPPYPRFLHGFEVVMAGRVSRAMAGRNNSRPRKREKRFFMLGGFIFGKSREKGRGGAEVYEFPPPLPALTA